MSEAEKEAERENVRLAIDVFLGADKLDIARVTMECLPTRGVRCRRHFIDFELSNMNEIHSRLSHKCTHFVYSYYDHE